MNSKYYTHEDLECHCGCGYQVASDTLIEALDELTDYIGQGPLEISCVCRCSEHNAEVGGVPNSQHVEGTAADIIVPEGMTVDELANAAEFMGFDGIGCYYEDEFVHVDVRNGRNSSAIYWTDED